MALAIAGCASAVLGQVSVRTDAQSFSATVMRGILVKFVVLVLAETPALGVVRTNPPVAGVSLDSYAVQPDCVMPVSRDVNREVAVERDIPQIMAGLVARA